MPTRGRRPTMLTILFDGIAYGMLLFVLACGLVRHARPDEFHQSRPRRVRHGGRLRHRRAGQPHGRAVPARRCRSRSWSRRCIGGVLERTLYVHVYAKSHLDQVLFTIGLVFMSVAAVDYVMGSSQQFVQIPNCAAGPVQRVRRRHGPLPPAHHRDLRRAHGRAAAHPRQDAVRQPAARRGRRPARRARARHQCRRGVRA